MEGGDPESTSASGESWRPLQRSHPSSAAPALWLRSTRSSPSPTLNFPWRDGAMSRRRRCARTLSPRRPLPGRFLSLLFSRARAQTRPEELSSSRRGQRGGAGGPAARRRRGEPLVPRPEGQDLQACTSRRARLKTRPGSPGEGVFPLLFQPPQRVQHFGKCQRYCHGWASWWFAASLAGKGGKAVAACPLTLSLRSSHLGRGEERCSLALKANSDFESQGDYPMDNPTGAGDRKALALGSPLSWVCVSEPLPGKSVSGAPGFPRSGQRFPVSFLLSSLSPVTLAGSHLLLGLGG